MTKLSPAAVLFNQNFSAATAREPHEVAGGLAACSDVGGDVAIKRLEAGEDPEKIEEDMGDVLGDFMGGPEGGASGGGYTKDSGLYDY